MTGDAAFVPDEMMARSKQATITMAEAAPYSGRHCSRRGIGARLDAPLSAVLVQVRWP